MEKNLEKLSRYKEKRNTDITPEPPAKVRKKNNKKLIFVVQHHSSRVEHYDFRLEWNGVLLSWAVPKGPSMNPENKRLAVKVEDHPYDYKDFEGTIPKGQYGGGTVMVWDEGFWESKGDVDEALKEGSLKFELFGKRLKGGFALVKLKTEKKEDNWLLIKEKDKYADEIDVTEIYQESVQSGRSMDEITKGIPNKKQKITKDQEIIDNSNPFDYISPQLAVAVKSAPKDQNWLYELKYDGYRILAYTEKGITRLFTRNGRDVTHYFKNVAAALSKHAGKRACVLDGEMVITDEKGKTDFQALQNHLKHTSENIPFYIVFDILALDGVDLRDKALIERKKILDEFFEKSPEGVTVSKYVIGNGEECFKAACKLNLEGVVGKKLTSTYSSKRNGDWIKLKCEKRQEFAIVGYTRTQKKTTGVSALLLAVYDKGKFTYIGRAGSGISIEEGIELEKKLKPLHSDECTVVNPPSLVKGENFFWVKPVLVAEVRYAEFTRDGIIRQASYKGLRIDKKSEEAVMEIISKTDKAKKENSDKDILSNIKITNPDKVLFSNPLVTKIDVVSYYAAVADRMLPYVKDRVLSIVRCPKGVGEPCFFKKHPDKEEYKGLKHIMVPSDDGESEYFYITEKEGLVAEAQMGTIEFHTWGSGVDDIERPDIMVFDLDPDEKMNISRIAEGAKDLKAVLDKMGLISFIKTSGGKGYHIVVPFEKGADWEEFKNFAKTVAIYMESKWPDKYTANMRKEKRKGRIFVDWVRNGRGATSIAPYSVRAREGAKVSMPIRWKELDSTMPDSYDIENSLIRIKKSDPWKDFFAIKQKLPQLRL